MKVIIDIVANHILGQCPDEASRGLWDAGGKITYPYDWFDIAALNYNSKELRLYMTDMLKYWIRRI